MLPEATDTAETGNALRADIDGADPAEWITGYLGEHLWSKQREIALAVRDHRRVAVHSAHDTGKSWLAARLMAWWIASHEPGQAFVVSTAPTATQVRAILWRELARAHRVGCLPGRLTHTEWWMDGTGQHYRAPRPGEELIAIGRKPSDYDPAAFQGIHAPAVLVVLDEANGIPIDLWVAASTLAANEESHVLAIGNPDDPTSRFAEVCTPGSGWHVVHVDGLESPNFTGEECPESVRRQLISPTWVEEVKRDWGEESALYIAKARGRFPENANTGTVPLSMVRACQGEVAEGTPDVPVELGVDVGAGGDQSVIRERRGPVVGRVWRSQTQDAMALCGLVVNAIKETGATAVKVDVIGWGWGVSGRLQELRREKVHAAAVVPVNVSERSSAPERFVNVRAELWWMGRELSRDRGWNLAGLDDASTAQLIAPTYTLDSAGRIVIEKKAETKKRLGRSPDDADALLLAFYNPPSTVGRIHF